MWEKQWHTQNHYLHQVFTSFTIQIISLYLFFLLLMIHFLETMQFRSGFIYCKKLFFTFSLKKIVFYLCDCNSNILSFHRKFRIWVFLAGIWKKLLPFLKSVPSNFSIWKVSCKNKKYLHLAQKMLYLGNFGLKFKKAIVIFEISDFEFVYLQNFLKKIKIPKFGIKSALFGYFWVRTLKNYCCIWN